MSGTILSRRTRLAAALALLALLALPGSSRAAQTGAWWHLDATAAP